MQLQLENVNYVYEPGTAFEKKALTDINLSFEKGVFVAVIGHTGCGKSTLIQHLNGLVKPTSGRVLFEDEDINAPNYNRKALRGKVGLVFQYPDHQLFEESIYKDVAFGPSNFLTDKEEIDRRVRTALEMVGIPEEDYEKSPFQLSGGQKKRVTIAGVIAMQPEVLILDEPTAGLDPVGRDEILESIRKIHRETNCTIIWVSHNMEHVARFAERIIVLGGGKVIYDDIPKRVFMKYKDLERIGLRAPEVTYIMHRLASAGVTVDTNCIRVSEAADNLLGILRNNRQE